MVNDSQAIHHFFYSLERKLPALNNSKVKVGVFFEAGYEKLAQELASNPLKPSSFDISIYSLETTPTEDILHLLDEKALNLFFYNVYTGLHPSPKGNPYIIPLKNYFEKHWQRCLPFIDVNEHFPEIYAYHPTILTHLNDTFIWQAGEAREIRITNSHGTNLTIQLDQEMKWTNVDGINSIDIIPSEVATHTKNINGYVAFAGTFLSAIPFARKYGVIDEPLIFELDSGYIRDIRSANDELRKDFEHYVNRSSSNGCVEELGFGTNIGVKKLYGYNTAFEERHPGLHLGLGGREKDSHHLDLIFSDSTIFFDEICVFDKREFLFKS